MEEEKITLIDLLGICLEFKQAPTPANELKLSEAIAKLTCREYLPLAYKKAVLILILNSAHSDTRDPVELETAIHVGEIIYGLLAYVINLDNTISPGDLKEEMADLLFETGVVSHIIAHCKEDFARLHDMVRGSLNFANIFKMVEVGELFNSESLDKLVDEIQSTRKELTPEMLQTLKNLAIEGSPEFNTLKDILTEAVLDKVMDLDLETLEDTKEQTDAAKIKKELENNTPEQTDEDGDA